MIRTVLAILLFVSPYLAKAEEPPPATVVVAFDAESITPLIVEGMADRETGRVVEANDPVRIASISKLIMALATLRLVDEGKVDLDADVSNYLGWQVRSPNFPDAPVTLAQLLSHRSGLRDKAGYVIPLGESLEAKLADPEAWYSDAPPGEAPFEYANLGSPVVATVLEAATGERYDRIVERTVFAPLGIEACLNWIGCSEEQIAKAVVLYRDTGEVARDDAADLPPNCTIPVEKGVECSLDNYLPGTNASIFSPQGGVRIGMMDLAKIGQALMETDEGEEFLSTGSYMVWSYQLIHAANADPPVGAASGFCGYGLGAYILVDAAPCSDGFFGDGAERVGHGGQAYGLRSGLWISHGDAPSFAYFTTAVPPPPGGEENGGAHPRETALMDRAQEILAQHSDD